MRNLLALFGLLIIGFVGIGWYMGWYKLSVTKSSDGNLEIKTNVDTKKVGADSSDALNKLGTVVGNQAEKAAQEAKNALPPVPAVTPGPLPQPPVPGPNVPITIPVAPDMPTTVPAPVAPPKGPIQLIPPK
jgi:hypothetical protein